MDWRDYIHSDPEILGGKPVFKGTRLSVELVLKLMAAGWTAEQMAEEYPGILPVYIPAAAAFAAELVHEEKGIAAHRARAA
jgi:uncharacterized protein (DUF433 family)